MPLAVAQILRAVLDALLERDVQYAQLILGAQALDDLSAERVVGQLDLAVLAIQFCEDRSFRAQDGRVDRFVQIINCAAAITFQNVLILIVLGGEKNDWNKSRFLPFLDYLRQL